LTALLRLTTDARRKFARDHALDSNAAAQHWGCAASSPRSKKIPEFCENALVIC
jgi:hypothetical protein